MELLEMVYAALSLNYYLHKGKITVAGTSVTVDEIANLYLVGSPPMEPANIAKHFDLNLAQVHLALSYYYDHKEEIDENHR